MAKTKAELGIRALNAFVVMPFAPKYDDVYLAIKRACDVTGFSCSRADKEIFHKSILQFVYQRIREADVVVAEMSERNPNVFYEVGYAHCLGKPVLLTTKSASDIPFDLRDYPHVIYEDKLHRLESQLRERLEWCLSEESLEEGLSRFCGRFHLYHRSTTDPNDLVVGKMNVRQGVAGNIHVSYEAVNRQGASVCYVGSLIERGNLIYVCLNGTHDEIANMVFCKPINREINLMKGIVAAHDMKFRPFAGKVMLSAKKLTTASALEKLGEPLDLVFG